MDRMRFSTIAYTTHRFCNPVGETQITTFIDRLALRSNRRLIDVGCGKGEILVRIVDRYGCTGIGIDINEDFLRATAKRIEASRLSCGFGATLLLPKQ
jgi:cyclopropane fatty-acyl-phospholipid synthase-like methyltransferase